MAADGILARRRERGARARAACLVNARDLGTVMVVADRIAVMPHGRMVRYQATSPVLCPPCNAIPTGCPPCPEGDGARRNRRSRIDPRRRRATEVAGGTARS
jgi:ABC-type glutathione transport system ATPase component